MVLSAENQKWLLDADPALVWRVERDLLGADEAQWQSTRSRVGSEGFGAELLAHQDADGQWAGGAFFPAGFFSDPANQELDGQPYTATTWSLSSLRDLGVQASALNDTARRLDRNCRWDYESLPYWGGEVDCCINAMTLANGTWLGADVSTLPEWFLEHQLDDGGWNCEWENGSVRSSFHSTLNSLVGILDYQRRVRAGSGPKGNSPAGTGSIGIGGMDARLSQARARGEEYLLSRNLLYRAHDGELVGNWVYKFRFPFRWAYSALRAVHYFLESAQFDAEKDAPDGREAAAATSRDVSASDVKTSVAAPSKEIPDPRLAGAVAAIRAARRPNGRWLQGPVMPGATWLDLDVPEGQESKWLTYYGTVVLDWWDSAHLA